MAIYVAIDLKSFYASVECVEHGFDPLTTNLVVADESRTEKTICLAVSPSLKAYGIPGRARLFEVVQKVKEINKERARKCHGHFIKDSYIDQEVQKDDRVALNYFVATPRMSLYMKYSNKIYSIYLKYVSKEDIHVYSIDEVFIDVTSYLNVYKFSAEELAMKMIRDILNETGITATCGIGTNLYLAKVAMDIIAKHAKPDENGVRMAKLDERSYRYQLWDHTPMTDFWRIGGGISARLEKLGCKCLGDVARLSLENEDKLYKEFGINAELIIDHAWGYESATIADIKAYVPMNNSLQSGQVLKEPYSFDKARLIIKEMSDLLALDLVEKELVADQIVLSVGYDISSVEGYKGEIVFDYYGRSVPKMAHGSINLGEFCSSSEIITLATLSLFDRIVDRNLKVRRVYIVANHLKPEELLENKETVVQTSLFEDAEKSEVAYKKHKEDLTKEKNMQKAIIEIHNKYGKNALIKANSLEEGATTVERNSQVGGHRA